MLHLNINDPIILTRVCHALSTELRLNILALLDQKTLSCLELSKQLDYPLSTISANVKILEEAGLIMTKLLPARNGSKKICSSVFQDMHIQLGQGAAIAESTRKQELEIPIGNYMDFQIKPSCGMVIDHFDLSELDTTRLFYAPERIRAGLIWLRQGYLEYRIPIDHHINLHMCSISFEMELCSEVPGFNNIFSSDITCWINGEEIGTWRSPGDFGDRRGRLTPAFWDDGNTQYGLLTKWKVSEKHTTINGEVVSDRAIESLRLEEQDYVTMRIGVKADAEQQGGLNLFGKAFGDYPQDIRMCIRYVEKNGKGS